MSFLGLLQVFIDVALLVFAGVMFFKLGRPQKDDPRLSKGLQLLQSKISILEDLSDRTETQVSQLSAILDNKCKELTSKIAEAEKEIAKIDSERKKSLDVAKIFQDKIPHEEIRERLNTIKYVQAAKLANQGVSREEIAQQVDLTTGELDFLINVNKDQLMFCEKSLPDWAITSSNPSKNSELTSNDEGVRFSDGCEQFNIRNLSKSVANKGDDLGFVLNVKKDSKPLKSQEKVEAENYKLMELSKQFGKISGDSSISLAHTIPKRASSFSKVDLNLNSESVVLLDESIARRKIDNGIVRSVVFPKITIPR